MLTPLELDIMKAVWSQPPITVRVVQSALRPHRKLAYTTVMTIMDRMYRKGLLTRTLRSRTHLYEPAIGYAEVRDTVLNTLVENFFGGSRERLREFLNGNSDEAAAIRSAVPTLDETLL